MKIEIFKLTGRRLCRPLGLCEQCGASNLLAALVSARLRVISRAGAPLDLLLSNKTNQRA